MANRFRALVAAGLITVVGVAIAWRSETRAQPAEHGSL
jgi:hypothetical protein